MRSISVTEFKAHCLELIAHVYKAREPIELTKRGKTIAVLQPPIGDDEVDWTPGAFKGQVRILGPIEIDGKDLGVEWDAMR